MACRTSMQFFGKMCLVITKNHGFILSIQNVVLQKPQEFKIDPLAFLGLNNDIVNIETPDEIWSF